MGTLEVDKLDPQSGTALEIGTSGDTVTVPSGVTLTVAGALNVTGTTALADGTVNVAELDIDGATDIGEAIVDADLFVVDNGAGGTNRKTAASRIKTYIDAPTLANDSNNRVVTGTGSGLNGEANLTFDGSTLAVTGAATVSTTLGVTGVLTGSAAIIGTTVEPTGDTSASDNAAIGYTAAEGLILTGQGSTNDVTVKNDADAAVIQVPTGTTNVEVVGHLLPTTDDGVDLGSASKQWRDVYTGDLNLNNTNGTRVNEVDGTSGSWTIQEGDEDLFLLNRLNGKKYKFNLTEME